MDELINILREEADSQNRSAGDGCDSDIITNDTLHWELESLLNNIADAIEHHLTKPCTRSAPQACDARRYKEFRR